MAEIEWQERLLALPDGTQIFALHGRHQQNHPDSKVDAKPTLVLLHEALGHIDM